MQVRVVPCNLNSGEKEAISSGAISKVISYFGQKKNQERELQLQEPIFFSSLQGLLHTRLHSDSSGCVVSVDLLFMPANTSFLSKKWNADQDKFTFSQCKITLEVLQVLLS